MPTARKNLISNGSEREAIYKCLAETIRELRTSFGGRGISQTELARAISTTANTVSRWEAGLYKPSVAETVALAQFFGVSLLQMIPGPKAPPRLNALLSALDGLDEADVQEVIRYALFRRATAEIKHRDNKTSS